MVVNVKTHHLRSVSPEGTSPRQNKQKEAKAEPMPFLAKFDE
jgi:hypothetical protein